MTVKLAEWLKNFKERMDQDLWTAECTLLDLEERKVAETERIYNASTAVIGDIEKQQARAIELYHLFEVEYKPIEQSFYDVFGGKDKFFSLMGNVGDQNDRIKSNT